MSDESPPNPISAAPIAQQLPLRFHGQTNEYFHIWIINLLLSIVTLGIYSAWAKVRSTRYFYGATELGGSRFDYHGKPVAILIGRLIALVLFIPYILLGKTHSLVAGCFLLLLFVASPFLITRALRFRLGMTSYRNLRFGFTGSIGDAAVNYLLLPMLLLPTLMLALPSVTHQQRKWVLDHARYGQQQFDLKPAVGGWYRAYFCALGSFIIFTICMFILIGVGIVSIGMSAKTGANPLLSFVPLASYIVMLAAYTTILRTLGGWLHKLVFERLTLGELHFSPNYRVTELFSLHLINSLALFFSLGLAYPWIRIRTTRYMVERLSLYAPAGLNAFIATTQGKTSAAGEEIADMFDVDIGL
ncbi:YjgN family protein [Chitinimonas sp. BJB300]|uniref:YjgN family protein n=1 Tax=Chitinimonas sp. BJB300 TaxID=1559339 RepID=UPI000C11304B|nr:YjgN family protein [Chitinimonas sp. BJB300]PHV12749.1 hypothetical protein CSQ89_04245 [Chitinimonas sp. BJB300]TSJ90928.1 DUF898 domain-containing protein [Chitinimonas sp. BJB300]